MKETYSKTSSLGPHIQLGRALVIIGCLLCLVSALFLPWSRAQAAWKDMPLLGDLELGSITARLTDNTPLAVIAAILSAAGIAGLAWKKRDWVMALLVSGLLIPVFVAYLVGVSTEAYETLGFYRRLLDSLRDVPYLGAIAGWIEETVRNHVVFSVTPLVGFYLFPVSAVLTAAGGILLRPRGARKNSVPLPLQSSEDSPCQDAQGGRGYPV
ncbi:MAG: hypothetical protein ACUVRX_00090 [Actinomycetota bacterium]